MRKMSLALAALLCTGCISTLSSPLGSVYSSADFNAAMDWTVTTKPGAVVIHAGPTLIELGVTGAKSDEWFGYELGPLAKGD